MIGVAMDITDWHEAEAERAKLEQRLVQAYA
jgi:hypothetical protein